MFRKNLIELTELQIKHTKVNLKFRILKMMNVCYFRLKFKQLKVLYNNLKHLHK
jgi:hypothetical protein